MTGKSAKPKTISQHMKSSWIKTYQDSHHRLKENILFQTVILQAILDAQYMGLETSLLNFKIDAIEWLVTNSDDFNFIVDLSGYNPEYIKRKIDLLVERKIIKYTKAQLELIYGDRPYKRTKFMIEDIEHDPS